MGHGVAYALTRSPQRVRIAAAIEAMGIRGGMIRPLVAAFRDDAAEFGFQGG